MLYSASPDDTLAIGQAIGSAVIAGDVFVLSGDLAAGKTLFVQGLATGMGIAPEVVHSPTFTLLHTYHGRLMLHHFDLYRVDEPGELDRQGFDEYLYENDGVAAVEWGGKFSGYMPEDAVWIDLHIGNAAQERELRFHCTDAAKLARLLSGFSNRLGGQA